MIDHIISTLSRRFDSPAPAADTGPVLGFYRHISGGVARTVVRASTAVLLLGAVALSGCAATDYHRTPFTGAAAGAIMSDGADLWRGKRVWVAHVTADNVEGGWVAHAEKYKGNLPLPFKNPGLVVHAGLSKAIWAAGGITAPNADAADIQLRAQVNRITLETVTANEGDYRACKVGMTVTLEHHDGSSNSHHITGLAKVPGSGTEFSREQGNPKVRFAPSAANVCGLAVAQALTTIK